MRKLLFILLLFPFVAKGQTATPIVMGSKYYEFKNALRPDSAFFLPRKDTSTTDVTLLAPGMLVYRTLDSLVYWRKGNKMTAFSPATGSAGYIQNQNASAQTADFWIKGTGRINSYLHVDSTASGEVRLRHTAKNSAGRPMVSVISSAYSAGSFWAGVEGTVIQFDTTLGRKLFFSPFNREGVLADNVRSVSPFESNPLYLDSIRAYFRLPPFAAGTQLPTQDSVYKRMSGRIIETVDELADYGPNDSLIYVTDIYRGGFFQWQETGTADDGVYFDGSSGIWRRHFNKANGVNVRWYGPAADSLTDDIAKIQAAVNRAAADTVGLVTMRGMNILIDSAIRIPSNITLDATGSYIEVKQYSNQYLVRNADFVNGNSNIEIFGGRWNGNGLTQTVSAGTDIETARACAGFFFYRSSKLHIHDLEVDSTKAWGISGINCDQVHVHNIHFEQNPIDVSGNPAVGINGDGVTFNAGNALIENITGFTNDDMVAFGCGGPSIANTPLPPVDLRDYENITIRNIAPSTRQGVTTHRGVGLYSRNGYKLSNITVDGVNGNTSAGAVLMSDPNGVGANFRNVKINNIGVNTVFISSSPSTYNAFGVIGFNAIKYIDNVSISNVNRYDTYSTPADMIKTTDSSIIGNMNLSNLSVKAKGARITFINDGGTIRNINMSNVMVLDSVGTFPQSLYTRSASNFISDTVRISGYAVNVTQDNSFVPIAKTGKKIWLNLPTVILDDTTDLVRKDGAAIYTRATGLNTFQNNRWYGHSMLNQSSVDQAFTGRVTGPVYSGSLGVGVTSLTSTFEVTGSVAMSHRVATGTTTAAGEVILYVNNSGAATVNLPAAASCPRRIYIIKKISANGNDVTIDPNAAENIDGVGTKVITLQYSSVVIQSSGSNWFIMSSHAAATTL